MKIKARHYILFLLVALSTLCTRPPETIDLSQAWRFAPDAQNIGMSHKWYAVDFDHSHWDVLDAGKRWEDQGYPDLDSLAWYRKSVHIPAGWKGKKVWIKFGGVNDAYTLFMNGDSVASFGKAGASIAMEESFAEITEHLKFGEKNIVAVRVNDWGNSGGLWQPPVIITTDEGKINPLLDKSSPIIIFGNEQQRLDVDRQDGGLRLLPGVHNIQIYRARIPDSGKGRWTYNHHQDLAIWRGRLYAVWATTPKDEDVPPYRVVYATSKDGFHWSEPADLFPEKIAWASRFYFYRASNGRMLALCPGVLNDAPAKAPTLLVREIAADHRLGRVFTLLGPSEGFPSLYTSANDAGFVAACREAAESNLLLEQGDYGLLLGERRMKWHALTPKYKGFYPFGKGFCFYHRRDGNVVGICKMGFVTVSEDEGKSWSKPVNPPTLVAGSAKTWGQRTANGRYILAYNPSRSKRYPLVLVHGDNGREFRDMRVVHGEFSPTRYPGLYKDPGPQYVRGVAEWADDGSLGDRTALWLLYSVNKEDIWISRVPLPIEPDENSFFSCDFDNMPPGRLVPGWNVYSPRWAPVRVAAEDGVHALELKDADPFDHARAVKIFPPSPAVRVELVLEAAQRDARLEIELCDSSGRRPIRLVLGENGRILAGDEGDAIDLGPYQADVKIEIAITVDLAANACAVQINGGRARTIGIAEKGVPSVERLSLRTGRTHVLQEHIGVDAATDAPMVEPAVFRLVSASVSLLK